MSSAVFFSFLRVCMYFARVCTKMLKARNTYRYIFLTVHTSGVFIFGVTDSLK